MHQSINPYAPPQHDGPDSTSRLNGDSARLEAIRREHINAETNVKGLGILLYLGAAGLIMTGLAGFATDARAGAVNVFLGGVLGLSAYWLRRLDRRGRLVYSFIVALGVAGTLLDGGPEPLSYRLGRMFWPLLFLAIIWGAKASTVMTPHYRDVVIPATPHVKHKTSPLVIVLLVLLVLLIVAAIVAGALS